MPPEQPQQQQGPSPEELKAELSGMAQEIISQMGPEVAMMLAQMIVEAVQGNGGNQESEVPAEEPVFAKLGGKLVRL